MLELGKRYKWSDISNEYPDMYAVITDMEKKDGLLDTCVLVEVVPFEKKEDAIIRYTKIGKKFACRRTTYSAPNVGGLF